MKKVQLACKGYTDCINQKVTEEQFRNLKIEITDPDKVINYAYQNVQVTLANSDQNNSEQFNHLYIEINHKIKQFKR